MDVRSLCPLRVASLIWQPARGGYVLTVVCKATFDLAPVASTLAHDQEDPNEHDNYWDDNPARSVHSPSDMAPYKPRADVLLVGHAFAPRGEPVASLVARLVVGELDKSIEVTGDRFFGRDGALHEGMRLSKMPLRYERAAAGPENPVGVRSEEANAYGAIPLPNLLPLGTRITSPSDFIAPVGFGPIAPGWRARAERLGPYAGKWPLKGWNERPLPEGLDPSYFNAAPRDQQVEIVRNDERILLENLHPSSPRFVTNLPGLRPQAFAEIPGRAPYELTLTCDTLWIDTERLLCTLTWRGQVPLEHPSQMGRVLVAMAQPGQRLLWADVERLDRASATLGDQSSDPAIIEVSPDDDDDDDDRQRTVAPDEAARLRAALPFAPSASSPPPLAVSAPRPVAPPHDRNTMGPSTIAGGVGPASPAPAWLVPAAPAEPLDTSFSGGAIAPPKPLAQPPPGPWLTPGSSISTAKAAQSGALAASNAAASASAVPQGAVVAEAPRPVASSEPASKQAPRELLDLLWFEKDAVRRMRAAMAWRGAFAGSEDGEWLVKKRSYKPVVEESERADVLRILTKVKPLGAEELLAEVADAVDESGVFSPPLVLLAGELQLAFDEVETLKANVTAVSPFASTDKRLRDAVDASNEALRSPWQISSGIAEGLLTRLREAFAQGGRALPQGYLETATERALLEQRRFQKRTILGQPRLRCLFTPAGGTSPVPAYFPESLAAQMPMFQRFRAKVAAEAQTQQDQYESHPVALLALALGRLLPVPAAMPARFPSAR